MISSFLVPLEYKNGSVSCKKWITAKVTHRHGERTVGNCRLCEAGPKPKCLVVSGVGLAAFVSNVINYKFFRILETCEWNHLKNYLIRL